MAEQFKIEIIYDEVVQLKISWDFTPELLLATMLEAFAKVVQESVQPESYPDYFNFVMKKLHEKLWTWPKEGTSPELVEGHGEQESWS